jgi:biotin transport system substrate-specific component
MNAGSESRWSITHASQSRWAVRLALTLAVPILMALAAQVRIPLPFTPVPFTLQGFVVLLAGFTLGPAAAAAGMLAYLGLGLAGGPVFSGGAAGWGVLTGFTGGYLMAFPGAAALTSWLARRAGPRAAWRIAAGFAGMALIHACGLAWLSALDPAPRGAASLLTWSLLPFLGIDAVKVLAAERLTRRGTRTRD